MRGFIVTPVLTTLPFHHTFLRFALISLGLLNMSVGNIGPKIGCSEKAVEEGGKTEGNIREQYVDIICMIRCQMTLGPTES